MRIIVETDLQDIIYIIYIVTFKKWMYSNLNVWHMIFCILLFSLKQTRILFEHYRSYYIHWFEIRNY